MEELQIAINENLKYQKQIKRKNYTKPELFNIINDYISTHELICYGGMAINNIIPESSERFYDDVDIPDYDCFTPNAIKDAKTLSQLLRTKYENVEVKSAMFKGTYKVFVNFIPIVDLTQIEYSLFEKIKQSSLKIQDIYYASPNYLRMNIHLELSRPLGDVSRWIKISQRLELLNKYHPFIYNKNINKTIVNYKDYNKVTEICKKWVILGEYAMKYFKFPSKYKSNSNIFVLLESLDEIKEALTKSNLTYTIVSYSNKFINNFYEFKFNTDGISESLLYVFITNSCQSYNEIKENGNIVKIANIDTMLMIYYALSFIQLPNLNINNLLLYCYLLQQITMKNKLNKITKRYTLPCIGKQSSFEDLRMERDNAYKLYKKNHSKKIYNDYFFRYVPHVSRANRKSKKNIKRLDV
jgi:hypothetical protein